MARTAMNEAWYVRRGEQRMGPYRSTELRHLLLRGEVDVDGQVSRDGQSWQPIVDVPEVVPPQLRGAAPVDEQELLAERRDQRRQALASLVVVAVLLSAVLGLVLWLDGSASSDADCSAVAGPGVNWQDCRLLSLSAPQADLRGVVLSNGAAPGARLSGADLAAADLRYTDLRGADLSYARLGGVNLKGADLRDADLTYAAVHHADLSFADLRGARLGGADLSETLLGGALWTDGRRCAENARGRCVPETAR